MLDWHLARGGQGAADTMGCSAARNGQGLRLTPGLDVHMCPYALWETQNRSKEACPVPQQPERNTGEWRVLPCTCPRGRLRSLRTGERTAREAGRTPPVQAHPRSPGSFPRDCVVWPLLLPPVRWAVRGELPERVYNRLTREHKKGSGITFCL